MSRVKRLDLGRFVIDKYGMGFCRRFVWSFSSLSAAFIFAVYGFASKERTLKFSEFTGEATSFEAAIGELGQFTWWMPEGADAYVLPISAGIYVDADRLDLMSWLRKGGPWSLTELPTFGLRFGDRMLVIIVPWPHYAQLVFGDRVGVRFEFPVGRFDASPNIIVGMIRDSDPMEVARSFREWRCSADDIGVIPRPRRLATKIEELKKVERLLGAPHLYLWGHALFSRFDVPRGKWVRFAKALNASLAGSVGAEIVKRFTEDQRGAIQQLATLEWPQDFLMRDVSAGIATALSGRSLLAAGSGVVATDTMQGNMRALDEDFGSLLNPIETWGDGLSGSMLDALQEAGIDRALLLLSDLYRETAREDVVLKAEAMGYLVGPYDSYHSIHSPDSEADDTWETAQFDLKGYQNGRVINHDGSGHGGFMGRGFHFSPEAAWPYVQERVDSIIDQAPYSTWFIDCDATAECFDDYHPDHPANRLEDAQLRRRRLTWLEKNRQMVVGSEGGSVLFSDVIHYGHGVHTPYIGHLDPAFRDRASPHFLGSHWPPDTPDISFKPVPVPKSLVTPYFDPTVRFPLYQAAIGDEVIATHHWSFDSMKFEDIEWTRELLEILYRVPPLYHLNRGSWPDRRERILKHLAFWGPLHREVATAPLLRFAYLSEDRQVQRATYQTATGEVSVTVNFGKSPHVDCPPRSAKVTGVASLRDKIYSMADG